MVFRMNTVLLVISFGMLGLFDVANGQVGMMPIVCTEKGDLMGHYVSACNMLTDSVEQIRIIACFDDGCTWTIFSGVVPFISKYIAFEEVNVVCDTTFTSCKVELVASYKLGIMGLEEIWTSTGFIGRLIVICVLCVAPALGWVVACSAGPVLLILTMGWTLVYAMATEYFILSGISGLKVG